MKIRRWDTKSISFKIFLAVMAVLVFFLVAISLLNFVFLKKVKTNFIYEQLYETARNELNLPDTNEGMIRYYLFEMQNVKFAVRADKLTERLFRQDKQDVLTGISLQILDEESQDAVRGRYKGPDEDYLYYAESIKDGEWLVYISSLRKDNPIDPIYILAFIFTVIAAFLASKLVSKRIVKPIRELERFADEVARHNWLAKVPDADTTEIANLAESLDKMKGTLQETQERERQFLQANSHNLKTPIMVIKGYAQAIKDGILHKPVLEMAEIISAESENLERRVGQLLKLNTYGYMMESEREDSEIRLDRLLNSMINRFSVVRGDVVFEGEREPVEMTGDSDALRTAFENIFENSVRFARTRIAVDLHVDEWIKVRIMNDGPRFSVDNPDVLFERYRKDESGQFGLGLAIVRQIVEAHGGRVEAVNLDEGVCFSIILPK